MVKSMFCPKCGTAANEGAAFCANCGARLTPAPEAPAAPAAPVSGAGFFAPAGDLSAPVAPVASAVTPAGPVEPVAAVEPVADAPAAPAAPAAPVFAEVDFDEPKKKKKAKKGGKLAALVISAVAVVAIAVGGWMHWDSISGFFVKTFGSPEAYAEHLEKAAIPDTADHVSSFYGALIDNTASNSTAAKGTMKLQVSKKLTQLMSSMGGEAMDLTWLNDTVVDYETAIDGELYMIKMDLAISKTEIIDLVLIMNMNTGEYFIGIPSLSSEYLHYDPSDYYYPGMAVSMNNPMYQLLSDEDFIDALPSEETFNSLLRKYLQIVTENLANVEESTDTLEIGDIEQKVTVLEYELTEKDFIKICKAVLKEAKNDKEIKKIINNMASYLESKGWIENADEAYTSFQEGIEIALEDEPESYGDSTVTITTYVNGASEIIGRKIEAEGQTLLDCVTLTKGKNFATEWRFADGMYVLTGEGTVSKDVRDGEYILTAEGTDVLEITASYNEKKLEDGQLDCSLLIKPAEAMLSEMGSASSIIKSMDLGLQLVVSTDVKSGSVAYNIVSGNEVLLGISAEGRNTGKQSVSTPDNYTSIDNADRWAANLDFDKLLTALENAGIPDDILYGLFGSMSDTYYYY